MKCVTCGVEIHTDCFKATVDGKEMFFHLRCKPIFYYFQFPRETTKEVINGKEWL